jgi:phosphate transport system substrate-binding protein
VTRSIRSSVAAAAVTAGGAILLSATPALGAGTGSGATFPALVDRDWCQQIGCSYTGVGSSAGIRAFTAGTVDFAGSDAVLTDGQRAALASRRGGVTPLYFPTLLGAISVPTNTSAGRLRLDGKVLARSSRAASPAGTTGGSSP